MSVQGITMTILATQLAEAVAKDDAEAKDESLPDRGHDIGAGLFGVHVSNWIRALAREIGEMGAAPARDAEDAAMLRFLIDACGHWQDGSSTVVKLFDDDATRQYLVKIGNRRYAGGGSMRAAIKAAMAADA